jgi:hypothetical protein
LGSLVNLCNKPERATLQERATTAHPREPARPEEALSAKKEKEKENTNQQQLL